MPEHGETSTGMATKNLTISLEASKALKQMKRENESFSQLVLRLSPSTNLNEFIGVITDERGQEILNEIQQTLTRHIQRRAKRLRQHGLS